MAKIVFVDLDNALSDINRNLNKFLSFRFAGQKWWLEFSGEDPKGARRSTESSESSSQLSPAFAPGGGLKLRVSCQTPGLRIHVSPAYFINWVYFGSPTTPVTSYVFPGRYIFAGDGPMLPKRTMDLGVFSIPPTNHATLIEF